MDSAITSTSGGEAIVNGLVAHGVDTVFGLPGAQIYGLFDAFHQAQLKVIGARHEQACGYMAFGYARSSGKPGVFSVVPGPGVLNASAALLTAFGCNEPVLCLTGQVPTHLIGTDAFQECDTVGITRHCSKHNYLVQETARLGPVLHEAFYIARSGRPGPVVIDIPKDVQIMKARYTKPGVISHKTYKTQVKGDLDPKRYTVRTVPGLLARSKAWDGYDDAAASIKAAVKKLAGKTK